MGAKIKSSKGSKLNLARGANKTDNAPINDMPHLPLLGTGGARVGI